jgi:GDP-mannose 6-dehydrogenase
MKDSVSDVLQYGDAIVIGNGTPEFRDIQPQLREGQVVIDLVRAFGTRTSDASYQGVAW